MAKAVFLEFEKQLGEISGKIEELENEEMQDGKDNRAAIEDLRTEFSRRTAEVYKELTPWQTSLVARHPNRPYTLDYINAIFEDFTELHGDRVYADDCSIVGGIARLAEHSVMVIGHQKGRDTRERTKRNFGMSRPEGYRKALRLMKLAEKFNLPVFTFIDTPGAYPGIGAEERNQSEAIGRNIFELSKLKVPVIATIIGEGGSGGALAIAVADTVLMLQYSTYSVISPEGCASILWKSAAKASDAAQALGLTADTLTKLGLVDKIVSEPIGGAHRDPVLMARTLKKVLVDQMKQMNMLSPDDLVARRVSRLLSYGKFESSSPSAVELITGTAAAAPVEVEHQQVEVKEVETMAVVTEEAAPAAEIPAQGAPAPRPKRTRTRKPRAVKAPAAEAATDVKPSEVVELGAEKSGK